MAPNVSRKRQSPTTSDIDETCHKMPAVPQGLASQLLDLLQMKAANRRFNKAREAAGADFLAESGFACSFDAPSDSLDTNSWLRRGGEGDLNDIIVAANRVQTLWSPTANTVGPSVNSDANVPTNINQQHMQYVHGIKELPGNLVGNGFLGIDAGDVRFKDDYEFGMMSQLEVEESWGGQEGEDVFPLGLDLLADPENINLEVAQLLHEMDVLTPAMPAPNNFMRNSSPSCSLSESQYESPQQHSSSVYYQAEAHHPVAYRQDIYRTISTESGESSACSNGRVMKRSSFKASEMGLPYSNLEDSSVHGPPTPQTVSRSNVGVSQPVNSSYQPSIILPTRSAEHNAGPLAFSMGASMGSTGTHADGSYVPLGPMSDQLSPGKHMPGVSQLADQSTIAGSSQMWSAQQSRQHRAPATFETTFVPATPKLLPPPGTPVFPNHLEEQTQVTLPADTTRFMSSGQFQDVECQPWNNNSAVGNLDDGAGLTAQGVGLASWGSGRAGVGVEQPNLVPGTHSGADVQCIGGVGPTLRIQGGVLMPDPPLRPLASRMEHLLVDCAEAIDRSDLHGAHRVMQALNAMVSPHGTAEQRMSYYFLEGLAARIVGTGSAIYKALQSRSGSEPGLGSKEMLAALLVFLEACPYANFGHVVSNGAILEAFEGESHVHIIDFGITHGTQWPTLIEALAMRPEGPPHLRITGIDAPQTGLKPSTMQETGRRLTSFSKLMGVPFEFNAVTEHLEALQPEQFDLRPGEALAVSCNLRLHQVIHETPSVHDASPRNQLLQVIRSLQPKIVTLVEQHTDHNLPSFSARFREAIHYYSALFSSLDMSLPWHSTERVLIEERVLGRKIVNIVACEGRDRVERHESLERWNQRMRQAGMEPMPLSEDVIDNVQCLLKRYREGYGLDTEGMSILLTWRGQRLLAASTWRCAELNS